MALRGHATLCLLGVTCAILLMTSPGSGQAMFYEEALLKKYVRVAQQLRAQMKRKTASLQNTLTSLNDGITNAATELVALQSGANAVATDVLTRVVNVTGYMQLNYAPVIHLWATDYLSSMNDQLYTEVKLNHGMTFDPVNTKITVPQDGTYFLSYQIRTNYYVSINVNVNDPSGGVILAAGGNQFYAGDTPRWHVLKLSAGSTVAMSNVKPWSSGYTLETYYIQIGFTCQATLRYLGPKE